MNIWNFLTSAPTETVGESLSELVSAVSPTLQTEPAAEAVLDFAPMNFVSNLQYMGIGMLTIFLIIGVIILATVLINKVFSHK